MTNVKVILLNWNGWRDTVECLDSLLHSRFESFGVIVCDNASTDGSVAEIKSWATTQLPAGSFASLDRAQVEAGACVGPQVKVTLVENGGNLGFAAGNNVGVRLAMNDPACQYVWLLNNDTTVDADALARLVARAEADASIGLCGSTLIYHRDQQMVQALGGSTFNRFSGKSRHIGAFSRRQDVPADPAPIEAAMSYVVGAAMLVRRAYLEQVGLMEEGYFLYYEEIDWCTRGKGRFRLGYAPDSLVFHKEGASIGTDASGGSALSVYYLYRNRVRFTSRFHPWLLPAVLTCCAWDIFKFLVKRRFVQVRAAARGVLQLPRHAETARRPA